jgi:TP901 family phage tail tape measure protein
VANVSAADVEELSVASQKAASVATTVGVDMDQLAATIATIETVTREAPENIGNGLKTIYSRLSDIKMGETLEDGVNLGQITSALAQVGVNVLDETGKMRDIGIVMEDLMGV